MLRFRLRQCQAAQLYRQQDRCCFCQGISAECRAIRDAEAAKNSSDKGMVMKKETLNEETQKTTTVVSGIVVGVIVIVAFVMLAILIRRRRKNMVE